MASVDIIGLDEFRLLLMALPDHLAELAGHIVQDEAEQARATIVAAYTAVRKTGNLARGVKLVAQAAGRYGAAYQVRSTARHAWLYEHGSQARHSGTHAALGAMPPNPILIQTAVRRRASMYQRLSDMVEREGFTVTRAA
jgi:hypothetical protein